MEKDICKTKRIASVKLTKEEVEWLKSKGYSDDDVKEIKYAITKTKYRTQSGQLLTQEEVIERMGRDEWLAGIAKSAFFVDTVKTDLKGRTIKFHSKVYEN